MKSWKIVVGSTAIWFCFFAFFVHGRNIQVAFYPVMGLFLRAAENTYHYGYTDQEFYFGASISELAFATLGVVAILKNSVSLAVVFAVLLSISSFMAMMPTVKV